MKNTVNNCCEKWFVWDGERELPHGFSTAKEARNACKIYNKERCDWEPKNYVFKRV